MGADKLYRQISLLMAGLLVIPILSGFAGCSHTGAEQAADIAPFYADRVATVRFIMSEDNWNYVKNNARQEEYVRADMWYEGELIKDIALRPKGNSSLSSAVGRGSIRFGLKADLNFFNSARSLDGIKKLNFNNGFSDPSFMREILSYELFRQMGVPAPRASFVDIWINDTHLGLYTMVEQVDKQFLGKNFGDGSGNLYKPEQPGAYLSWTSEDLLIQQARQSGSKPDEAAENGTINLGGGKLDEIQQALEHGYSTSTEENVSERWPQSGMPMVPPVMAAGGQPGGRGAGAPGMPGGQKGYLESMNLKTNENSDDHDALLNMLDVLNNKQGADLTKELEKVLDVDEVLRYLAVCTALVHLDNYTGQFGHNYYLYEEDGKFSVIPWDCNMAFGTFNSGLSEDGIINFLIDEPTAGAVTDHPLVARLLDIPAYLDTYHGYLLELIEGPFSPEVMNARIDSLASLIRPYVESDTLKFASTEAFERSIADVAGTSNQNSQESSSSRGMHMLNLNLKSFVSRRVDSIKKQLDGRLPSKSADGSGNGGNSRGPGVPGGQRPPLMPFTQPETINPAIPDGEEQ